MAEKTELVSVVVPVFNEAECLDELLRRSAAALEAAGRDWELLLINDGSGPEYSAALAAHAAADRRVKVVNLSRNFGHQAALTAGLHLARGQAVVLMDGDLQDPPEVMTAMIAAWERGADVVIGERDSRRETGLRGLGFRLFHRLINSLIDFRIQANSGIFCLLARRPLEELLRFNESNRFLPGLRSYLGFRTEVVHYDRPERAAGESKQSLARLAKYGLDAVFSFSYKPLRLTLTLGVFILFAACGYAAVLVAQRLLNIHVVPGFTTNAVATLVLGSVQLISIGIMGEYVGRIYDEVKRRPMYIIRDAINLGERPWT
jgi:polyisoprenyl-phosphate glycosyltransferase